MKRLILTMLLFLVVVSWHPEQMLYAQANGFAVTLDWTAPTERTDGTPLFNLAGYRLYQSGLSGEYGEVPLIDLDNPGLVTYVHDGVQPGQWFYVITAYDSDGLESGHSNEASVTVVGPNAPPKAPAGLGAVFN